MHAIIGKCLSLTAALLLCATLAEAQNNNTSRQDRSSRNPNDRKTTTQSERNTRSDRRGIDMHHTARELTFLDIEDLREILKEHLRKNNLSIPGFTPSMAERVLHMAVADRHATRRLIREMERLTGVSQRRTRLRTEVQGMQARLAKLEAALDNAEAKGFESAAKETLGKIIATQSYIAAVKTWQASPREGRL